MVSSRWARETSPNELTDLVLKGSSMDGREGSEPDARQERGSLVGRIQAERALGQLESGGGREKEGGGRRAHSPTSPSPAPVDRPDELSSPSEQHDPCALERESERQRPTEIQVSERGREGGQRA